VISRARGGLVAVNRPGFDGEQQREALTALQKAAGLEATAAAQAVGLSYPQYNRYLWGHVPLRTDQISAFAAAYKVSRAELTRALGLLDDEVDPAIRERFDEAAGALPVTETTRDEAARMIGRLAPEVQRDLLEQIAHVARTEPRNDE
jgi:hypothetical protein